MKKLIPILVAVTFLIGCSAIPKATVTLTTVVDSATKQYAKVYNKGGISPEIHAKVKAAHDKYREAAAEAEKALIVYKNSGDQAAYIQAFNTARSVATSLIDMIAPLLTPSNATQLKANLERAYKI